ncbi:MAG: hypothetical protein PSV17_04500 [Methylotenera sp.]|uniref:hypothetical protein n=1 Tax=Methylotenera sp. TaxID=2051956 RepID=UPI0024878721|nr:hypothetical protein [Methylotenera sp.]MDI1308679.1 hypothetical protein [Methylotenera sp.]
MATLFLVACSDTSNGEIFTLYRNSLTDSNMRIHVATFDSQDGEVYNKGNCDQAQLLFQNQPEINTKFWCEKGQFKQ